MHGPVWVWGLNYHGPGSDPNATRAGSWNYATKSWTSGEVYSRSSLPMWRFYMLGVIYAGL